MTERAKQESFFRQFVRKWQSNPLYSTGLVLVLMIIVQTIAQASIFPVSGIGLPIGAKTGSISCGITRLWAWWPWA